MEKDLDTALRVLFEGRDADVGIDMADGAGVAGDGDADAGGIRSVAELSGDAMRYYNQAQELAADGDWAGYGRALDNLERTLGLLADLTGVQDKDISINSTNGNSANGTNTNST